MWNWLVEEESGQGMVEYALILAFIALVVIGAVSGVGQKLVQFYEDAVTKFPN